MSRRALLVVAAVIAAGVLMLREHVVMTQPLQGAPTDPSGLPWAGVDVPGTGLRVWTQGAPQDLPKYSGMAAAIWGAFSTYFPHPLEDVPGLDVPATMANSLLVNPNNRVDIYVIGEREPDPRWGNCQNCALGTTVGWAREDPATVRARTGSGYVLLKKQQTDDDLIDAMAHELAHVAQRRFDWDERRGGEAWLQESTATWVAYKVMRAIGRSRAWEYRLLDDRLPPLFGEGLSPPLFNSLDRPLHRSGNNYAGFLFFSYASDKLGDDIVTQVWQSAAAPGAQGIDAVDQAIPFAEHFPGFTVRNLNERFLPGRYKDTDPTFPDPLLPKPIDEMPSGLGEWELSRPVENLSARYYRFKWPDAKVRRVTLRNFVHDVPDAHVWAVRKIGADWKDPEDWSRDETHQFCRDLPLENVTELVLVVSNSHLRLPISQLAPDAQSPVMVVEDVGCQVITGTAQSTLRLTDDRQDVTYTSSRATLHFKPRAVQDQPGNVQYDLLPTSVTWTVSGTQDGCTLAGSAVVTIPAFPNLPLDPTRPAFGYLNVVDADGGDVHSVQVSAVDPAARMTKSCPSGTVTREPFQSVWLLNVLSQANAHAGGAVEFTGTQTLDPGRFQDSLPAAARDFLMGTTPPAPPGRGASPPSAGVGPPQGIGVASSIFGNLPGIDAAQIEAAMAQARQALQQADLRAGQTVYTFTWQLRPAAGGPPVP